jgi:hypothetical protein
MREFTPEEKELIVNTEITPDCFEKWEDYKYEEIKVKNFSYPSEKWKDCTILLYPTTLYESIIRDCEVVRRKYLETKNEHYFDILVRMLPNSYKVVNLCVEKKDICKAKHMVPETPHYGKKSRAVPFAEEE